MSDNIGSCRSVSRGVLLYCLTSVIWVNVHLDISTVSDLCRIQCIYPKVGRRVLFLMRFHQYETLSSRSKKYG